MAGITNLKKMAPYSWHKTKYCLTNVTLSVEIFYTYSQKPTFKIWLDMVIKEGMGLAELEEFNLGVSSKFKSTKLKNKPPSDPKVRDSVMGKAMKLKLADE